MITETAYAKLNLALHVRRRRDDGYHEIETIFAFCADGDVLRGEAVEDAGSGLLIDGPFAQSLVADESNLVLKAEQLLQAQMKMRFRLTKNLPIASGIGGGSADAAASIRLIYRLWDDSVGEVFSVGGLEQPAPHPNPAKAGQVVRSLDEIARSLGADVGPCIHSVTMRGEGLGTELALLNQGLAGTPVLLVNPGVAVSTPDIFKRWDQVDRGPLGHDEDLLALARRSRNDLTPIAISLQPVIADVLAALEAQSGTSLVRMSGSGATCFALFHDDAARDEAAQKIAEIRPEWWQLRSRLR